MRRWQRRAGTASCAQVQSVVQAYLPAQADGDTARACSLVTGHAVQQLKDLAGDYITLVNASCATALRALPQAVGAGTLRKFEFVHVHNIVVRGDEARYVVAGPDLATAQPGAAERRAGRWLVSSIPGIGG